MNDRTYRKFVRFNLRQRVDMLKVPLLHDTCLVGIAECSLFNQQICGASAVQCPSDQCLPPSFE